MLAPDKSTPLHRVYQRTLARYDFRQAGVADVDGIVDLWPEHWDEAHYKDRGIEFDENRYRQWTHNKIYRRAGVFIIAIERSRAQIVGFYSYDLDHSFSVEPFAVMGMFYVRREHRRSAVPAILFDLALQAMQEDGACALHAPIASESLAARALENMFLKNGFKPIGCIMGRTL